MKIIFINHKSFTTEKDQLTPEQLCVMISAPKDNVDIYMNDAPFPLTSLTNAISISHNDRFEIMRRETPSRLSSIVAKNIRGEYKEGETPLSQTVSKIPAPVVEKPDFESLAIELINERCSVVDHGHDCACGHVQDAMEKIWNDHVLPLHSIIKSKDGQLKNADATLIERMKEIYSKDEEIARLKEALKAKGHSS